MEKIIKDLKVLQKKFEDMRDLYIENDTDNFYERGLAVAYNVAAESLKEEISKIDKD